MSRFPEDLDMAINYQLDNDKEVETEYYVTVADVHIGVFGNIDKAILAACKYLTNMTLRTIDTFEGELVQIDLYEDDSCAAEAVVTFGVNDWYAWEELE